MIADLLLRAVHPDHEAAAGDRPVPAGPVRIDAFGRNPALPAGPGLGPAPAP